MKLLTPESAKKLKENAALYVVHEGAQTHTGNAVSAGERVFFRNIVNKFQIGEPARHRDIEPTCILALTTSGELAPLHYVNLTTEPLLRAEITMEFSHFTSFAVKTWPDNRNARSQMKKWFHNCVTMAGDMGDRGGKYKTAILRCKKPSCPGFLPEVLVSLTHGEVKAGEIGCIDLGEDVYQKIGAQLVQLLNLKKRGDRVNTTWGTKTESGLAKCVQRIITEAGIHSL